MRFSVDDIFCAVYLSLLLESIRKFWKLEFYASLGQGVWSKTGSKLKKCKGSIWKFTWVSSSWTREQTKERWMTLAMQVKRWITEHVKARWLLHALNWRRDGCCMRWIREQLKVLWMYQAMDHEEIHGAIDQGASYRSRCKHYGSGTKRWINEQ
jgi:hypothetical protein